MTLRERGARLGGKARRRIRRGAGLLPSALTVGNLFAGFFAIMAATDDRFVPAAAAIIVAGFLDLIDGRIARLTGSATEFGSQLDSLADAVSFGVAPAVMVQQWALVPLARVGWGAAFLFAACGVIRLARFNTRHTLADHRYFAGLPIPMAAMAMAAAIIVGREVGGGPPPPWAVAAGVVALALLMVSPVRYRTFKQLDLRAHPYLSTAGLAIFVAASVAEPSAVLALVAGAYVLSGPVEATRRRLVARSPATRTAATPEGTDGVS